MPEEDISPVFAMKTPVKRSSPNLATNPLTPPPGMARFQDILRIGILCYTAGPDTNIELHLL